MLVIDPKKRASIAKVIESYPFQKLLSEHPQPKERVLYHNGKYLFIEEMNSSPEWTAVKVKRVKEPADKALFRV